jgi:hypothetical protein
MAHKKTWTRQPHWMPTPAVWFKSLSVLCRINMGKGLATTKIRMALFLLRNNLNHRYVLSTSNHLRNSNKKRVPMDCSVSANTAISLLTLIA